MDIVVSSNACNVTGFEEYLHEHILLRLELVSEEEGHLSELGFDGLTGESGEWEDMHDYLTSKKNATFLTALVGGVVAGALMLVEDHNTWGVEWVYVKEVYRGQGIGKGLVEYAINHAKAHSANMLSLSVVENNPASTLYAELGFKPSYKFMTLSL